MGFYSSKAGYLSRLPDAMKAFNSKVPDDIDSLITLPGVGRKTANLVMSMAFHKDAIVCGYPCTPHHEYLGICQNQNPF